MYATYAVMFMTLKQAIPITEWLPAQHGKMYPKIGYARSAA